MSSISLSSYSVDNHHVSDFPSVSWKERDSRVQQLIDESFQTRVLPLHQGMFEGRLMNYLYTGSLDYTFEDPKQSCLGVSALKIAEEFAKKERFSVLDLGTGNGRFLQSLKDRFENVDVMGVSAADFRNTKYDRHEFEIPDKEYVVGNLENLSQLPALQDRKFDFIVAAITIRHLSDPLGFLCQAYEMLQPNGVLIVDDFKLNGLTGLDYAKLFEDQGYDAQVLPETYANSRICKIMNAEKPFRMPFPNPDCTRIRKTTEHLTLPVTYDVERSTKASEDEQAHIFYKTLLEPSEFDDR